MARKQSAGYRVVSVMLHILTLALAIVVIAWLGMQAYHFSYKVFADIPYAEDGGEELVATIRIDQKASAMEVAEMLENAGLVEDKWVFWFQIVFSQADDEIQEGSYRLESTMSAETMIASITAITETEEEATDSPTSVTAGSASKLDESLSSEDAK